MVEGGWREVVEEDMVVEEEMGVEGVVGEGMVVEGGRGGGVQTTGKRWDLLTSHTGEGGEIHTNQPGY